MLLWTLLAFGQVNLRKVDGWQTLATAPSSWRFRRANSHHIPGVTSALSCNQLRTTHGA
jgi:hypothetical protein